MSKTWDIITITISGEAQYEQMRAILEYEANARGSSYGQAFSQLVANAIDLDAYPPEVRERLEQLRAERQAQAIEKCLAVAS